ncbi:MAG: DMT family transporter [Pseudomonadales bacterium]|nr:DMT family transporter [Pseudomonadales bacterium]
MKKQNDETSMLQLALLAILAGAAIAAQAAMNSQLGQLLKNALLASSIAFSSSVIFSLLALLTFFRHFPDWPSIKAVPVYLWFSGGVLSAFAIATFYWLIPKMGVGSVMSFALTGQLLFAVMVSHFGWFQLPIAPLNITKLIGIAALITGITLLNLPGDRIR